MDSMFSAITALVVGVTSTKAFDYYWRVYKNKSDVAGGEVRAKDQTIAILQERAEDLLKAYQGLELKHEELMKFDFAACRKVEQKPHQYLRKLRSFKS